MTFFEVFEFSPKRVRLNKVFENFRVFEGQGVAEHNIVKVWMFSNVFSGQLLFRNVVGVHLNLVKVRMFSNVFWGQLFYRNVVESVYFCWISMISSVQHVHSKLVFETESCCFQKVFEPFLSKELSSKKCSNLFSFGFHYCFRREFSIFFRFDECR